MQITAEPPVFFLVGLLLLCTQRSSPVARPAGAARLPLCTRCPRRCCRPGAQGEGRRRSAGGRGGGVQPGGGAHQVHGGHGAGPHPVGQPQGQEPTGPHRGLLPRWAGGRAQQADGAAGQRAHGAASCCMACCMATAVPPPPARHGTASCCMACCMATAVLPPPASPPAQPPSPFTCRRPPRRHHQPGAQPALPQVLPLHRRLDGARLERGPQDAHHDHQVPRRLPHRRRLEPHAVRQLQKGHRGRGGRELLLVLGVWRGGAAAC